MLEAQSGKLPPCQRRKWNSCIAMKKERTTVAKVPIHFLGFLANVDDSITELQLRDGFVIEKGSPSDVVPFLQVIDSSWGERARRDIWPDGCYRVVKLNVAELEATGRGGVAIDPVVCEKAHISGRAKLRLLRLFKGGNVVLPYSFLYHLDENGGGPAVFSPMREYPIADRTPFTLSLEEVPQAQSFIDSVSLPLPRPLDLAFKSFESSYETYDIGLSFLSLMIAMEVVLNPSDHELRYRVSRNTGVLLGQDRKDGETIYREMKKLYDQRSGLVHMGDTSVIAREDVLRLRRYVRETIKEAMRSGTSKDALLDMLNSCGFGEKPWRAEQ
jgi:hypothetical protein